MEDGVPTKEGYNAVKHLSDEELEQQKQLALEACAAENNKYLKCIENGGINLLRSGFCYEDNQNFWKCYKEKRGFLSWKLRRIIDKSNNMSVKYENEGRNVNTNKSGIININKNDENDND